jgi:hypothetical protein
MERSASINDNDDSVDQPESSVFNLASTTTGSDELEKTKGCCKRAQLFAGYAI